MGDAVHEPVAESICVNAGGDGGIRFALKVALKINDRTPCSEFASDFYVHKCLSHVE